MEYQERIVCYFDILGFGDNVCKKIFSAERITVLFEELRTIVDDYTTDDIQISHFSDSFIISILSRTSAPTQLRFVVDILIKLLEYKLIARGAIVYGEVIHTTANIFGPALVKAVCIEENRAKYPRIVLDKSLDILPLPTVGNAEIVYRQYFNGFAFVKTDNIDKEYYVDFISEAFKRKNSEMLIANLKELIAKGIDQPKIAMKYLWLQGKINDLMDSFH